MLWLERKYLSTVTPHLEVCKWKGDSTLNHRCLYCGDSQKNRYKARAYHFLVDQSFIYKCHNCGKSTSSMTFLKDHFPVQYKEYVKELLQEKHGKKNTNQRMPSSNAFKFKPKTTESLNTDATKMTIENLKFIAKPAIESKVAREYLDNRKIPVESQKELWFVDSAQSLSFLSDKYKDRPLGNNPRIVLPFIKNGELVGVSGRAIDDSPLRYLTMRFRDDDSLIFNIDKVNMTKTIYVTEGPLDSLFLPNSIAVGGSDFKKIDNAIKDNAIIIYDNEPRNKEILKKIDGVIDEGYRVCIWNDKRVEGLKDINNMIMSGMTSEDIVSIIDNCTTEGLTAKLKLKEYKRI